MKDIVNRMLDRKKCGFVGCGPYDFTDHDFRNDYEAIIEAYLAEHDPTPLDAEWLLSVGGFIEYPGDDLREIVEFTADGWEMLRVVFPKLPRMSPCVVARRANKLTKLDGLDVPTRGAFRTAMRMLGIRLTETP
jgi:hypothetical protein